MTNPRRLGPLALVAAGICIIVLLGLGVWQVQRLGWKTDLIARVEARVHADPVSPPSPATWAGMTEAADEYLRIALQGHYLTDKDTLVLAVTDEGSGFWVMTPFVSDAGWTVLVNRGFVPQERRTPADRPVPQGEISVTGLLRLTQPGGGFLRSNDPANDRWYSRDTAAIAAARDLGPVAPWFVDADRSGDGLPIGGLTVVSFRNHHLQYALTWFAMAAGLAAVTIYLARRPREEDEG